MAFFKAQVIFFLPLKASIAYGGNEMRKNEFSLQSVFKVYSKVSASRDLLESRHARFRKMPPKLKRF